MRHEGTGGSDRRCPCAFLAVRCRAARVLRGARAARPGGRECPA